MKYALSLALAALVTTAAAAQDADEKSTENMIISADDVELDDFRWVKRPLVVFADTPNDPRFAEQMEYLEGGLSALEARDVIVITDTDPEARTEIRRKLRPRGFGLVGIAKDGSIFLRKPTPWAIREITRSIDKLPTRQQELRDRGSGS
jgi:hypothetical protein